MIKVGIAGANELQKEDFFYNLQRRYDGTKIKIAICLHSPIDEIVNIAMNRHGTEEEKQKLVGKEVEKIKEFTHLILFTYASMDNPTLKLFAMDAIYERVYNLFVAPQKVKTILVTTPGDKTERVAAFLSGIILDDGKKG